MGYTAAFGPSLRQRGFAHDAPNSARARVRRGIKALNAHFGNAQWRKKINLATFNIHSIDNCALAQVFGGFGEGFRKVYGPLGEFRLAIDNGFVANGPGDINALQAAWKSELRPR